MKAGLTEAERDQLQANVEKIHQAWTNGGTYLAPPTMGELCDVDPALLVTPPAGLEIGYVPIATSQAWGGWVTNTWHQATSGNWSTTDNWAAGSAPEGGGSLVLPDPFRAGGELHDDQRSQQRVWLRRICGQPVEFFGRGDARRESHHPHRRRGGLSPD
jgi:hypothetical protein